MPDNEDMLNAHSERGYSLYDLVVMSDAGELDKLDGRMLQETSPHTLSVFLGRLDVDTQREILRNFDPERASEIVSEMDADQSAELVSEMREHRAVSVLNEMDPNDAADIVRELEDDDRDRLLKGMSESQPDSAADVRELLEYPEDTAGAIMNPRVATLRDDITVDEAIAQVRKMRDEEVRYPSSRAAAAIFRRTAGLTFTALENIMSRNLIGLLAPTMDKEVVAHIMADTNYHTLPVVSESGEILGIITHDDVMDILRDEGTEDMQKLAGAGADESLFDPILAGVRQRAPWLLVNLITAFIASGVVSAFDENIAVLPLLAVFMPIIAGIGGNTGAQTLSVTVRSIALGEVGLFDMTNICRRETFKGFLNGITIGALAAGMAIVTTHRLDFAAVVWVAMIINMSLGGFMGSFIPFTLKRFGFDPASGSSIFTTGATDSGGFFIFLGLGSIFLV